MSEYINDNTTDYSKKICIIGGNGYIGTRLIEFLLFRTDYHITVISLKFHKFNIVPSERIITVTGNQDDLPYEFYKTFDSIITFAPFSFNLVKKLGSDQIFVFTDPRYQRLMNNNHYYYIDHAEINGFSQSFNTSNSINKEVFLYKNNLKDRIEQNNVEFVSIFDFCRFIETILIYSTKSFSGRYSLSSETSQFHPFDFISFDTYSSIIDDILTNWNRINNFQISYKCIICQNECKPTKNNPDFLNCTTCFHIQRKLLNITLAHEDKFNETFEEYFLLEHHNYFIGIQNLLVITPWDLKENQKTFLKILIESMSKNDLTIEFVSPSEINNVYSLFDVVLIPYGIDKINNPQVFFSNLLGKLFDNGKIIIQTTNTLPFVNRYNFDKDLGNCFYNTSSMKNLCSQVGLKLCNSHYSTASNLNVFICYKSTNNQQDYLVDTFLYELENEIYDQSSY